MYTIKQAALRAGVSVQVLRAWERRYGIVRPDRTPSGYRLYDETAIDRVRAMRRLVEEGWTASQAALQIEAHGVPTSPAPSQRASQNGVGGDADLSGAFVEAAAGMDDAGVEMILDEAFASGSFERVVEQRLMPALRALGDAWADGVVSVAAEHAASHAVLRRLSAAFEAASRLDVESPVLVGLPPGSRHELGALAFATAVRRRGIGVVYLGADVPELSWRDAAGITRARAVVVGIPTPADRGPAEGVAHAMTETGGLLVAVGGPGAPEAQLPGEVMRLPDDIPKAAAALEQALEGALAGHRS
jgi:MerR family transcriptional regulator, light-induced transcriptional regulator